jgi:lipid-binding SYLF domain-containing protein
MHMNLSKKSLSFSAAALAAIGVSLGAVGALAQDREELVQDAQNTLQSIEQQDPNFTGLINSAAGYAVFPNINKGGFVFGGGGGDGVLFQNGHAIGRVHMTQATVGAQIGGASFSQLILLQNASALSDFKSGRVKIQASASAVAASAGAAANIHYQRGVAIVVQPKGGLLAEAVVGGQHFNFRPFYRPVEAPRS